MLRHSHGLLPGPAAKVAFDHNLHRCLSQTIIVFVFIVISSNHHHYHQRFVHAEAEHDLLLIISASGIFLYASYTIIAGYLR